MKRIVRLDPLAFGRAAVDFRYGFWSESANVDWRLQWTLTPEVKAISS